MKNDNLPKRIFKLLIDKGTLLSSEIASELRIDVVLLRNATLKYRTDGVMSITKVLMPGYKNRTCNQYKITDKYMSAEQQRIILGEAHFEDVPRTADGEFNAADPFRIAGKNGIGRMVLPSEMRYPSGKCVTILDNDEPEAPQEFSCALWLGGKELHLRRGNNVFGVLTKAEAKELMRYLMMNMKEIYS